VLIATLLARMQALRTQRATLNFSATLKTLDIDSHASATPEARTLHLSVPEMFSRRRNTVQTPPSRPVSPRVLDEQNGLFTISREFQRHRKNSDLVRACRPSGSGLVSWQYEGCHPAVAAPPALLAALSVAHTLPNAHYENVMLHTRQPTQSAPQTTLRLLWPQGVPWARVNPARRPQAAMLSLIRPHHRLIVNRAHDDARRDHVHKEAHRKSKRNEAAR